MEETRNYVMRVVIAEDDAITLQWMKRKIEELGIDCVVAGTFADGSRALEFIRENGADVLFTDIRMPVMDGMELLNHLRKERYPLYKVIFSAYDSFAYARLAVKLGAHEYVSKSEVTGDGLRQILTEAKAWLAENHRSEQDGQKPDDSGKMYADSPQHLKRERILRRLIAEGGDEGALKRLSAEIKVDLRRLVFVNLYFKGEISRNTVMEFLCLYLEQDGRRGDCFQCGSQEFSIIFNQDNETRIPEDLERLRLILQSHLGMEAYMGVSRAGGKNMQRAKGRGQQRYARGKRKQGGEAADFLPELYRQASAARENRHFFGIPGCMYYGQLLITAPAEMGLGETVDRIAVCLGGARYEDAMKELKAFLDAMRAAAAFHPAYVRALSNRILNSYLQEARKYPLDDNERRDVDGIELWLGWSASDLDEMGRALLRVAVFLDGLLKRKDRAMVCSVPVRQAMQYVKDHYGGKVTLEEVADYVHLSRAYLSSLFRKETGLKFSTYLQIERLEQARALLPDRSITIQEIADRTGFFDAAHLSRAFRARFGCSPMEYRKAEARERREE